MSMYIYIYIYVCVCVYICVYIFCTFVYLYLIVYNWCKNGHFNLSLIYFELGKHECIDAYLLILILVFIVLKHCIICIFLIHSDSVQKMLTALFKLVWNTQKITWTSTKARCFLILKMFWCLNALPYCFFLHIFEVKVSNFYWPITWEM